MEMSAPARPPAPRPAGVDLAQRSYFTISEVATLIGVSRVTIWRWITAGRLPVTRLSRRTVRVERRELERLMLAAARDTRPRASRQSSATTEAAPRARWAASGADGHFVLFYDADRFLLDGVADFLVPTLQAGERGIVVATEDHRAGIAERLLASGVNVSDVRATGQLVELDAEQTLGRFMVDGTPDAARFAEVVHTLVEGAAGDMARPKIYGEMVALLVAQCNPRAALELEGLWNQMQRSYPFSLLCGYPMDYLSGESLAPVFAMVCTQHTSVVPTESYSRLNDADDRLREIVVLQQKAASLEKALIAERAAHDQAEAALRTREEFLSIASHELRTPITLLGGQAQLLLRRVARDGQLDPDRVEQTLRTIGRQANKLGRLVGQLLDISQLDAGKLAVEPQRVDLVALVEEVLSTLRPLTSEAHTFRVEAPAVLAADVDPVRFEQVLSNLLDNALRYSPNGGRIEVVLRRSSPERVEVSVRDYGLGIPAMARQGVFERFYQAHASAYRSGMGLGLYVCRQIVELHGGEIRAEFPADGGTRIRVELPSPAR